MFDKIFEFEKKLAEFTGAKFTIMTDCCTHAIELCLRYDQVKHCKFTPYTYLSVPMTMHKLSIDYNYLDHQRQQWVGEYQFINTRIWDSARKLTPNMYQKNQLQCLSFGFNKPLNIGRGGAILLDDETAYNAISRMRYDGRDLSTSPWENQKEFIVGYHYKPTIEEAVLGLQKLKSYIWESPKEILYPDCRKIQIVE
jgi:dTDP-4-amino-4,6-dideoxygalactose transaminase